MTQNQPGELNAICEALGGAGINIDSLVAEGWGSTGVIKLVTTDPESAKKVIEQKGYRAEVTDVFTVLIPDKPGELAKVTKRLRDGGINIDCLYLLNKAGDKTEIALATDRVADAKKLLGV